jgi:protease-4
MMNGPIDNDNMSDENQQPDFFSELVREVRQLTQAVGDYWMYFSSGLRNQLRGLRRARLDFVIMTVGGGLPERDAPARSFIERQLPLPAPAFSLQALNRRLKAIADAENVIGVVFVFDGFNAGLASLQNFRTAVHRLRQAGKKVVVFTPYLNLAHYYAASAADQIIIPPGTQFDVLGLRAEVIFMKDALSRLGIEADAIQVSPYKTGPNMFTESDITPEHREQLNELLDEWYDIVTVEMAAGRQKSQDEMKQLIDLAPYQAAETLAHGLVDHVAYEDELAGLLVNSIEAHEAENGTTPSAAQGVNVTTAGEDEPAAAGRVKLEPWSKAYPLLMEKPRRPSRKKIGVISLEGIIMMGSSRQSPFNLPVPFLGDATAGERTLVRLLRRAEQFDDLAALIFHVDSGGGSSLASDLIGRQIERISQRMPVLVYMGNAAASGGYYVSAPAHHIMSQTCTLTGSIGAYILHISTRELYRTLSLNRVNLDRGKRVGLNSDAAPLSEDERQVYQEAIADTYQQFKQVVAKGRAIAFDDLEPICEGRVWTGRQALQHHLVDSHGDFVDAVHKAAELAGMPVDDQQSISVVNLYPSSDRYELPRPFEANTALVELGRIFDGRPWQQLARKPLFMMPFEIRLK